MCTYLPLSIISSIAYLLTYLPIIIIHEPTYYLYLTGTLNSIFILGYEFEWHWKVGWVFVSSWLRSEYVDFENHIIRLLDNILESLNKEIEARLLTKRFIKFKYVVNRKIISCVFKYTLIMCCFCTNLCSKHFFLIYGWNHL